MALFVLFCLLLLFGMHKGYIDRCASIALQLSSTDYLAVLIVYRLTLSFLGLYELPCKK